jgi:DNA polymerase III subunit delta
MADVFPAVCLLAGDPFLAEQKYDQILKALQAKTKGELAVHSRSLSETSLDSILSEARSLPFLTAAQIFKLSNAQVLKEKNSEALERYLKSPSDFSYLVFEAESIEKDHFLSKLLASSGGVFLMEPSQKKKSGDRLIREKMRRAGKNLTPDAMEILEEQAGDAPAFLDSVLDQLILYSGTEKEITGAMVEAFKENWKEPNVFALTDAIAARKTGEALVLANQILEKSDREMIGLLGLLHWQIRRFWQAKTLLEEGAAQAEIMRRCRISPKQAPFFWRQLQSFTRKKLEKILEGLFDLDWKLKTGRAEGNAAIETWLVNATK